MYGRDDDEHCFDGPRRDEELFELRSSTRTVLLATGERHRRRLVLRRQWRARPTRISLVLPMTWTPNDVGKRR